jgi:hypothetical protein
MDQIITLLSNLFNLTKVASVTLPGLALAGALALFLMPPHPVDTVRIPTIVKSAKALPDEQKPCSDLPALEHGTGKGTCGPTAAPNQTRGPACVLTPVHLNFFDEKSNFKNPVTPEPIRTLCSELKASAPASTESNKSLKNQVRGWCGTNFQNGQIAEELDDLKSSIATVCVQAARESTEQSDRDLRKSVEALCNPWTWPWISEGSLALTSLFKESGQQNADASHIDIDDIEGTKHRIIALATGNEQHPWEPKILKQFVLETARDRLAQCDEIERSRQGQEEADNAQLTTDIANLDKQRSDLQDAYIASLKTNDRIISKNFREKLSGILGLLDDYRERYNVNLISVKERARRLEDIKQEQDNVSARLGEPGRLRPITGFDLYAQGLVNNVVGLILLSIALSLILLAFDRSVLGNLFESLFPGW